MIVSACLAFLIYLIPIHNLLLSGMVMFAAGLFVYGPQANFWPMSPDLLGEKYVATGIGIMNMCAYLFAALGEPLLGHVIDSTGGNTSSVFIVIMIICLVCAIVVSTIQYKSNVKKVLTIV